VGQERDPERWREVYATEPEFFERFSLAEDPGGRVPPWLADQAGLGRGAGTLLEIGCGTGRWTGALGGRVLALEPEPGMLAIAARSGARGVRWLRARGEALPLAAGSVEVAFAGFVFANLRPRVRAAALGEVRRVLAPGGVLWVLENAGDDGYQALRAAAGLATPRETEVLTRDLAFEPVATLATRMEFASEGEARRVLGSLLGRRVDRRLERRPLAGLEHRLALLRWRG